MAHQFVDKMMKELSRYFAKDYILLAFPKVEFELQTISSGDELIVRSKFIDTKVSFFEEQKVAFLTEKKNELIHDVVDLVYFHHLLGPKIRTYVV